MAQAIFGLSHLRSSLPAAAFAHLVPPRIASSIIVPSYRPQLMMQPSTMVWMAAFLLFAAVDVNGEAHAECEKVGTEMETNAPKAADGSPCFGSRRLGALLPDLQHSSPFHGRRLQSSMEEMQKMCEPSCKAGLEKLVTACAAFMEGEEAEGLKGMLSMCEEINSPCAKALMPMMDGQCDLGECPPHEGEVCKVCTVSDSCKASVCAMVGSCDASEPVMGVEASDWKEGVESVTEAVKDCPCPTDSTTSGSHVHTASFGVMLLLAFLIFLQQ
eukprot:gnl/TRDRNA2_/TRDRNA2_175728_c1_seq2.p1 gnl/TRDRNA2_/TRDRNA2_175728_c1~~gnl/TRDRNA2_/TRDRNA2_175728_c1_seq2.p1  ORF type:complete len:272 (-),score=35.61 gnl/TRDRNA2_/TRDRNA2_175728_c1_seq2:131-946(-)